MMDYDIYVSTLCLITYVMFVMISVVIVATIMKLSIKLIRSGSVDGEILDEYERNNDNELVYNFIRGVSYVFVTVVFIVLSVVFTLSLLVQYSDEIDFGGLPTYRVVQTGSMAEKHEKNTYLAENGLDNQIQTFDLIQTSTLPDEMDLKLYDVVVYEVDGMLIVHRIVGIEEPNERHPDCRHFKLQGDAVEAPDRFPVLYEQMKAIYTGVRVPYVGSFVLFMQSPVGWLCIILVLISIIATPILEKKMQEEKNDRIRLYRGRYF